MKTSLSFLASFTALTLTQTAWAAEKVEFAAEDDADESVAETEPTVVEPQPKSDDETSESERDEGGDAEILRNDSRGSLLLAAQGHIGLGSIFATSTTTTGSAGVFPLGANVLVAGLPGDGAFVLGGRATFGGYLPLSGGGSGLWGTGAQFMLGAVVGRNKPTNFHYFMGGGGAEILFTGGASTTAVKLSGLWGTSLSGLGLGAGFDLLFGDGYVMSTLVANIGYADLL